VPYIAQKHRPRLDEHIEKLAEEIKKIAEEEGDKEVSFAGLLNYACTRLALKVIPGRRYWAIALITGVFKNIADEFYRRYGVPYEEEKIQQNSDVY